MTDELPEGITFGFPLGEELVMLQIKVGDCVKCYPNSHGFMQCQDELKDIIKAVYDYGHERGLDDADAAGDWTGYYGCVCDDDD